jgi:hypothetical protein
MRISKQLHTLGDPSELAELVFESSGLASGGGGAYAEALIHGLGVGGVGAKPTRRLAQQLPRRSSRASGGEHGWKGRIDKRRVVMTLRAVMIG